MRGRPRSRIQTTIALAFTALVAGTALVIALLSYTFTEEAVRRTSQDYTSQLIGQVQTSIDTYIAHMEYIAEVVHLNEQVQAYFGEERSALAVDAPGQTARRDQIISFLDSISRTRDDISLILIVGDNGEIVTHDNSLEINGNVLVPDQEWYRRAIRSSGWTVVSPPHVQNIIRGVYPWVITLSRTINDRETGRVRGVMLVDLNFSVINELVNRVTFGRKGYLFIVDPDGRIVYHPRQELIYSGLEREYIDRVLSNTYGSFTVEDGRGERVYTVRSSTRTRWRTVGVAYSSELVRNRDRIGRYYTWWALLCLLVAIAVSFVVSVYLSRPIMRLRESMKAVERGNFDIQVDVHTSNEIGDLARDFSIMVAQIRKLIRKNAADLEQKRKSELLALQNQITPHFLYNTLDSVIWMAEARQHDHVVTTISALARLLRLSISHGDELITIKNEIEHIKSYLTIQKIRYRDTLDYEILVDEAILDFRIPKIVLQPLVENAIYHGIKNKEESGRVEVHGRRYGSEVVLTVVDDGVGIPEEQMRALLDPSRPDGAVRTDGRNGTRVGVRNVHDRIRLYFGTSYGLEFRSNDSGGTSVRVKLPVVPGEEHT